MEKKLKQILVRYGEQKKIASLVHCSQPIIRKALKGDSRSELAMKIRQIAKKMGGVEMINNTKTI